MIFVDTGVWAASAIRSDPQHASARQLLTLHSRELVTTDLVVSETLTLLRARGRFNESVEAGRLFFVERPEIVHRLTDEQWAASWRVFSEFVDKQWSFADCASYTDHI